jgi:hypothetical protein
MIYYIIDRRFPRAFRRSVDLGTRTGSDKLMDFEFPYLYHFVYPGQSIRTIVADTGRYMAQAKWGAGSVDMIRLCGHGNSGWLEIGEGLTEANTAAFSGLAGYMKRDSSRVGIEIHGCGVGSDTSIAGCVPGSTQQEKDPRGQILLTKLAKAINRNVKAGLNCQWVSENDNWKFEGPTITVKPDGTSWVLNG